MWPVGQSPPQGQVLGPVQSEDGVNTACLLPALGDSRAGANTMGGPCRLVPRVLAALWMLSPALICPVFSYLPGSRSQCPEGRVLPPPPPTVLALTALLFLFLSPPLDLKCQDPCPQGVPSAYPTASGPGSEGTHRKGEDLEMRPQGSSCKSPPVWSLPDPHHHIHSLPDPHHTHSSPDTPSYTQLT